MAKKKKHNPQKRKEQLKQEPGNKILLIIFLILCVVVFVLATIMITKNANAKNNRYDIRVPITEQELSMGINIKVNTDDVKKNQSKEYRIQVTNYIDNKINNKIMRYQMKFTPSNKKDKIDIELYSNKDNFELLDGKKKITDLSIGKNKKKTIIYTLKLTKRSEPRKKEYVNINITKNK